MAALTQARAALRAAGLDGDIAAVTTLTSGFTPNHVWLVTWADGTRRVVKHSTAAPAGLYAAEAEGLRALAERGGAVAPAVHHADDHLLLLDALTPLNAEDPPPAFWEDLGRAVARLHATPAPGARHGWHADGWLGHLPQHNPWTDDGYDFFATHRILRYLPEPRAQQALTPADRAAVERLCARLPDFVPPTPPALTHGDLWHANIVTTADGTPAFIDPAVSFTWPDADLSMFHASAATPGQSDRFFAAYAELRPLGEGWRERMEVLHLRELLSTLAHAGDRWGALDHVRRITVRYA
ncbi:fructosamine kinase family protein [Streptomyces sp. 6N223]|uniref:fructosamine kinase family protein n=1 Tax=Streptomyces sp. 6N223 TaxID=3457412 RepID=UPI003FD10B02